MQGDIAPDTTVQDTANEAADLAPQVETNASTEEHAVQSNLVVDQPQADGDAVPNNFQGMAMPRHIDPSWVIHVPSVKKKRKDYSKKNMDTGTKDDGNHTASNAVIDGAKDSTTDTSSNVAATVATMEVTDVTISDIPVGKEVEAIEEVSASAENTVEAVPVVTEKQQLTPEGAATVVGTAKSSVPVPKKKVNGQLERAKSPYHN